MKKFPNTVQPPSQNLSADHAVPLKERLAVMAIGISVNTFVSSYLFDFLLYPFVIWKLGIIQGGFLMTGLAGIFCYLTFVFYDWSKKDWLGIETIKSLKNYDGATKLGRITSWILKQSDPVIMLFLSIKYDAFITTAYMRHGAHQFNGLTKRDWKIFGLSLAISNLYWTFASFMGVSLIEYVWKRFQGI
jgi:hypothetical protein